MVSIIFVVSMIYCTVFYPQTVQKSLENGQHYFCSRRLFILFSPWHKPQRVKKKSRKWWALFLLPTIIKHLVPLDTNPQKIQKSLENGEHYFCYRRLYILCSPWHKPEKVSFFNKTTIAMVSMIFVVSIVQFLPPNSSKKSIKWWADDYYTSCSPWQKLFLFSLVQWWVLFL